MTSESRNVHAWTRRAIVALACATVAWLPPSGGSSLPAPFFPLTASLLLYRTIAGPMGRLSASAEHVSHNIGARAKLPQLAGRTDEIGQMNAAFPTMTESLYRRIEASELFAREVAHELKNPLTAARSTAESLAYAKTPEMRDELVRQIQGELARLNKLITDVSDVSRLGAELAYGGATHVAKPRKVAPK